MAHKGFTRSGVTYLPVPRNSHDGVGQHLAPAPGANLTSTHIQRIRSSLDQSTSDNTRKSYASAWASFQSRARIRGATAMPASPALVAAYLTHLAEERCVPVTAIVALHKAAGHQDPTDSEGVKSTPHISAVEPGCSEAQ